MVGPGVLLGLAAERVLVGAADAGGEHPQQHCSGFQLLGIRKALELELPGRDEGCGKYIGGHRRDGRRHTHRDER